MKQSGFKSGWRCGAQLVVVLACAVLLKYFYSTASVNQLRWILAPTTFLVETISGKRFDFESHAGYMSQDHTFLIAASCAGVNFLLTSFLMLALGKLWRERRRSVAWRFLPIAAILAYLTTLVANTVRISTAIRLHGIASPDSWLNPAEIHRVEGIVIYFGFLLLLFLLDERFNTQTAVGKRIGLPGWVCFPLVIYYLTTLALPLLNGAYRQGREFWQHSFFVVVTPLLLIAPFWLLFLVRAKQNNSSSADSLPAPASLRSGVH